MSDTDEVDPRRTAGPRHAEPAPAPHAEAFFAQLVALTPRARVTNSIVAINVIVFAAMLAGQAHWLMPDQATLLQWGGNYAPWTTRGEWWRLATAVFIHGGIVHLALTSVSLLSVGGFLERLVGHSGVLVTYLFSGLLASLTSATANPASLSVGSSGAIFGLFGALIARLFRDRSAIPREVLRPLSRNIAVVLVLNLAVGFAIPVIDNAAHIGGLAAGALLGLVLAPPPGRGGRRGHRASAGAAALAGAALVAIGIALIPRFADVPAEVEKTRQVESAAIRAAHDALQAARLGILSDDALAMRLQVGVLAPLGRERARLAALTHVPRGHDALLKAVLHTIDSRIQAYDAIVARIDGRSSASGPVVVPAPAGAAP